MEKKIRAYLSKVIDETGNVFEDIASRRGLEFKCEKRNPDYVEFGASVTIRLPNRLKK